jgi:hypothetical protein
MDVMAAVHVMNREVWTENRERDVEEIIAMGQRVRADLWRRGGELTHQPHDAPGPLAGFSVAQMLLLHNGHDRLHLRWALDGLAARAAD